MKTQQWGPITAVVGLILIGFSYLLPMVVQGSSNWTDEKAHELIETSAALKGHVHNHEGEEAHAPVNQEELQARHDELQAELTAAQSGGTTTASVVWVLGALIAVVGVLVVVANRSE